MAVSLKQVVEIGKYLIEQRLSGRKRFALALMLEPLFRCNLACPGCGKIQHPSEILRRHLTPEECFRAVEECGAPVVTIPGGEPLLHPQIDQIVEGMVDRGKFVYLCTNAILLEKSLDKFRPSDYLSFSVHLDGLAHEHDRAVDREGVFEIAVRAIKAAKARGFRVTTNTTIFNDTDPAQVQKFFDFLTSLGVDGMMVSPAYGYEWAPDQEHFLQREQTRALFRAILAPYRAGENQWNFNHNPMFLDFLEGLEDYDCTPWGMPSYSVLGWQKPCYLLNEGHYASWQELLDNTRWEDYGPKSGHPQCRDCMMHCGYEPTAALGALELHRLPRMAANLLTGR